MNNIVTTGMEPEGPFDRESLIKQMQEEYDKLQNKPIEELRSLLFSAIGKMSNLLMVCAACVRRIQEAGEDIQLTNGMRIWFEKLADCSLLPQAIQQFYPKPIMLNAVARMPIPTQAAIVRDEPLTVVRFDRGAKQIESVPPSRLEARDVAQVFGPDGIRDEGQQVQWLRARVRPEVEAKPEALPYEIKKNRFHVNRPTMFTKAELTRILEQM